MASQQKENQYYDPYNGGQFNPLPKFEPPASGNTSLEARMNAITGAVARSGAPLLNQLNYMAGAGFARAEEATRNARSEIKRDNERYMGDLLGVGLDAEDGAFGGSNSLLGQIWGEQEENAVKWPGSKGGRS